MHPQLIGGVYNEFVGQTILGAVIREQNVTLAIAEGVSRGGDAYRYRFDVCKGEQAAVLISAPFGSWDQDAIDAILVRCYSEIA
jgi:hypothetical protein